MAKHNASGEANTDTPPKRIQLRRTKGWRKPEGAVVVSRPSLWGNPFKVGEPYRFETEDRMYVGVVSTKAEAAILFREYMYNSIGSNAEHSRELAIAELRGIDLCCWCPLDKPCHADVLLEIANA